MSSSPSPRPVSFIRATPALAELREVLAVASSITDASKRLGVSCNRLDSYYRATDDEEVKRLYRACVARGKRRSTVPRWRVIWDDPRTPGQSVCIWSVLAETEKQALELAVKATGREEARLKVEEAKT